MGALHLSHLVYCVDDALSRRENYIEIIKRVKLNYKEGIIQEENLKYCMNVFGKILNRQELCPEEIAKQQNIIDKLSDLCLSLAHSLLYPGELELSLA